MGKSAHEYGDAAGNHAGHLRVVGHHHRPDPFQRGIRVRLVKRPAIPRDIAGLGTDFAAAHLPAARSDACHGAIRR